MTHLSAKQRQRRLGYGRANLMPPRRLAGEQLWHVIATQQGERMLQWQPGIEAWHDRDGQRWNAETAGDLGWRYVALADAPSAVA